MANFREDDVYVHARSNDEFTVSVYRNPVEHKIRLMQVTKWAEPTTKDGPIGVTKRERVRRLLQNT